MPLVYVHGIGTWTGRALPNLLRRSSRNRLIVIALAGMLVAGLVVAATVSGAAQASAAGAYVPLSPVRILDTRNAVGVPTTTPVPGQGSVELQVTGAGGVPGGAVGAVVLNVTVTQPTWEGFVTVYPTGSARPTVSNLNFAAGRTVPNLVTVKVGEDGKVSLFNGQFEPGKTVHIIADVAGYYLSGEATEAGTYTPLVPARILDTRNAVGVSTTTPVLGQGSVELQVTGAGGVPGGAVGAVVLNVTVTQPTWEGFVTVYPTGSARPTVSNLNFAAGRTVPNLVTVKVGEGGRVSLFNGQFEPGKTAHVIADVAGYYLAGQASQPGAFVALSPARVLDTRNATGIATTTPIPGQSGVALQVTGAGGVPGGAVGAVVLNVTVTQPTWEGYVTAYPTGTTRPTVSNLNFASGQTVPNLVVVKVGGGGQVTFFNGQFEPAKSAHLIADVAGYFLTDMPSPVADVAVDGVTTSAITLAWTNPPPVTFTGVTIRRVVGASPPATPSDGVLAVQTTGAVNVWTDEGLVAGQTYSYALFAQYGDGSGHAPPATITVTVPTAASLTGTVTGPGGPVAGATVQVVDVSNGLEAAHVSTADDGTYAVAGLPPGTYTVCVNPAGASPGPDGLGYLPQCWDQIGPGETPTPVTVSAGSHVAGINANLVTAGSISGTVTDSDSDPIEGVVVSVDQPGGDPAAYAVTDNLGQWSVAGMPTGSYGVCFDPSQVPGASYAPECFDDQSPSSTRTLVEITEGSAVANVDVVLQTESPAAAPGRGAGRTATALAPLPYGVYPSTSLGGLVCEDVLFLAARGSGQSGPGGVKLDPADPHAGLGGPVRTAYEAFMAGIIDGRTVTRPVTVSYAADNVLPNVVTGTYIPDLWQGVKEVRRALIARASQCPNERIVLAGYSQGAMVMHRVLHNATTDGVATVLSTSILNRVDAAILIADGDRVADDTTHNYGSAKDSAHGVGTQLDGTVKPVSKLPAGVGVGTFSVCNARDIVCDLRLAPVVGCVLLCAAHGTVVHLGYEDTQVVKEAAAAAASWVQTFPAIGGAPITITGSVGLPLSVQLEATYLGDIAWSLAPGSPLPAGLTLSGTGLIHGTPQSTVAGQDVDIRLTTTILGVDSTITARVTVTVVPPNFPTAWSAQVAPLPSDTYPTPFSAVTAVACPGGASCYAVGSYRAGFSFERPLLLVGAGDAWVSVPAPGSPVGGFLDIACGSVTGCVAVGADTALSRHRPLMYVGSGDDWTRLEVTLPADYGSQHDARLSRVACPSSTVCVAAGSYHTTAGVPKVFLLTGVDGTWTTVGLALPVASTLVNLSDIACPSLTACVAVGTSNVSSGFDGGPLVVSGFGDSWTAIAGPLPPSELGRSGGLESISCPSPTQCVAVGTYQEGFSYPFGLILTGFGTTWTPQAAPEPADSSRNGSPYISNTVLYSVSCPSSASCVAVGHYITQDGTYDGVLLTGTPGGWSAQTATLPADAGPRDHEDDIVHSMLYAVDCPTAGSCLALGEYRTASSTISAFVTSIAGPGWTSTGVPLPTDPLDVFANFHSLDCVSVFFCAAGGEYNPGFQQREGLVLTGPGPG